MSQKLKAALIAFAIFFAGFGASAQVTTSSLFGRVADGNGEAVAGAAVLAVHVPSGTQYAAIANGDGRYAVNGMRAGGPYTIEFSFLGLNTVRYNDVTLKLGDPYELNVVMRADNQLKAAYVVGEKPFNASVTGAGSSFDRGALETSPTIDRSIYDVVKFTPQASINKDGGISFAGSNNRFNSFQIDGAMSNDTFGLAASGTNGGQTGANPVSLDAIEEIQVVIAPFDVRQSGFTGGAINAITKSGTNQVKGSVYGYYNNQDFMGTTPGKDVKNRKKLTEESTQTYGFTVGAPIIKNKLFLFLNGEYRKKSYPNVYTPANKSYEGTNLKKDIEIDGTNYGKVFNAELAKMAIEHYKDVYAPHASESIGEHMVSDRAITGLARIDWNINKENKLMVRYQFADSYSDRYSSYNRAYYFNNSSYKMVNRTHTAVAELNSRISPSLHNLLRASAVIVRDHRDVPYKAPTMYIQDNITIDLGTEYSSGANSMDSDTYTLTDNLSWYLGKHELTFGTHNEFYSFNNLFLQAAYGEYVFSNLNDFFNDKPNQFVYRFADPEVTGSDNPIWKAQTYAAQFGLYAQDDWRPNTNFSLTYGLRVDLPMLLNKPTENPGFNASSIAVRTGEKVGVVPKPAVMFSPRVGFRWFLNDTHMTLLRGGAGLFTGRVPFVWLSNAYNNTGMEAKGLTVNNPTWSKDLYKSTNPYRDIVKAGLAAAGGKATINTLNRNFKYPQVFRVNLGFEQVFGQGWKFTFDGIYSKTLNNIYCSNLALTSNSKVYAVNAATGPAAPYYDVDNQYQAVIALENTNKGYTWSGSAKLEKHFDFGLDLMAAYTFTRSMSTNDGLSSVALSNWRNNWAVDSNKPELSYSMFDKPHKISAVASYTTPTYGRIFSTTVSLTYEGGSGQRFSYTMNEGDADFNGDGSKGNTLLYIPTAEQVGKMKWEDPADAAKFENFIRGDKYLYNHRGQWSERNGGIADWENHFDLHIAENIFYDKKNGRKVELMLDIKNIGNLFNRAWGAYYGSVWYKQVLGVAELTKGADGNYTPTYRFAPGNFTFSDFYSRWRAQIGCRITF